MVEDKHGIIAKIARRRQLPRRDGLGALPSPPSSCSADAPPRRPPTVGSGPPIFNGRCSKNRLLKCIRALPTGEACDADLAPKRRRGRRPRTPNPRNPSCSSSPFPAAPPSVPVTSTACSTTRSTSCSRNPPPTPRRCAAPPSTSASPTRGYVVTLDVPGVTREDVKVSIDGRRVSIVAEARAAEAAATSAGRRRRRSRRRPPTA